MNKLKLIFLAVALILFLSLSAIRTFAGPGYMIYIPMIQQSTTCADEFAMRSECP